MYLRCDLSQDDDDDDNEFVYQFIYRATLNEQQTFQMPTSKGKCG